MLICYHIALFCFYVWEQYAHFYLCSCCFNYMTPFLFPCLLHWFNRVLLCFVPWFYIWSTFLLMLIFSFRGKLAAIWFCLILLVATFGCHWKCYCTLTCCYCNLGAFVHHFEKILILEMVESRRYVSPYKPTLSCIALLDSTNVMLQIPQYFIMSLSHLFKLISFVTILVIVDLLKVLIEFSFITCISCITLLGYLTST